MVNGVLVTFLVIVGAGFAVLIGYATSHRFLAQRGQYVDPDQSLENTVGPHSQAAYMANVRDRNRQDLVSNYGGKYMLRPVVQDVESGVGTSQY